MVKSTIVVLGDGTQTLIKEDLLCSISSVLCYEDQYFTWVLVVIGWILACWVAYWQYTKTIESTCDDNHNVWVKEIRDKLSIIEEKSISFWTSPENTIDTQRYFSTIIREVKELTTIADEISKMGNVTYPTKIILNFRKAVTSDDGIMNLPFQLQDPKIKNIINSCNNLRQLYKRK
ncbi:hypothetical protein VXS06_17680 [Photobacterium toruni]|uniref:Uncharacterized protein n=1 Tax=Photobacterium toruni TaxID=1935446 RepID=A0ABU6LBJ4_9GAMM|nr:hypothetical protein [Photobacterium toruni]